MGGRAMVGPGSDPLSAWWLGLAPATLEFWVRFPNERPGISHEAVMSRRRRRRRPGGHTTAVPPSLQIPPHTHILLARSPAPYSPFRRRAHSPTAFSGPMARPPPSPPRPPPSHARRMDGFCNQNANQLGSLAGPSLLTVYVGVVECVSASLTHARRMDGFCSQNADQLGSLAGPSLSKDGNPLVDGRLTVRRMWRVVGTC
jgi:hypothetical protein